jgi:hypothetical protein
MNSRVLRNFALAAIIATSVSGFSAKAFADSGPWMRWKQGYRETKVVSHSPGGVVYVHENSAVPALAGFLGGLVIGSAIHAQPVVHEHVIMSSQPYAPAYAYYDPWCDRSFASLEACASYERYENHPQVIRVVDVYSGEYVSSYRWRAGDWRNDDGCERHGEGRDRDRHDNGQHRGWDHNGHGHDHGDD